METALFRRALPPRSAWEVTRTYGLALAACALGLGLTIPLYPYLQHAPRVFLFCAVLASGRFGGLGPGLLAVALTSAASRWCLPGAEDAWDWVSLGTYLLVSLAAVAVVAQLRHRTLVLRDKEKQLTDFMENATVGLQWLAEDGTVLWANKATCRMLDCNSAKCCMGHKFQDYCVHPALGHAVLKRLARDERLKDYEITLRARDGSPRIVLLDANVLWKAGRFVHARCFLRDITARKQAEQAVQENVAKFRAVFDQSIDAIVVFQDGRLLMANPACFKLFGYEHLEALASRDVLEMIAPSHRPQVREYFERRSRGDTAPFHYQTRGRREDGAEFDLEVTASAFILQEQPHTLAILRDVTERTRADEALRKSEASLKLAQRIGCIGSWEADLEKDTLVWSEETYRIFGCTPETFTPSAAGFFERVHPDDRVAVRRAADHALQQGRYYSVDYRILRADGSERFLVQQARILRNEAGRPARMIGTVQDITERKRVEMALRESVTEREKAEDAIRLLNEQLEARVQERTRQLEQANRELEAFSYSISHDLRAPVRAISGFAQIIEEDYGQRLDGEVARLFQIISSSARRMGELIDDLLAFSRLNAQETERASVDMTALAQSVIAELWRDQPDSKAGVRLAELPEALGDESMLRQVFSNLISNAVKFSRQNPAPVVEIGARSEAGRNVYFVRDNGVGFDMKYAAKLFKVFQRLHNAEQFEGTGVGLAIVGRIVQRHGGEVWAESQPGKGAVFFFTLPSAPGALSGARGDSSAEALVAH
jgi:PAS domain S-box-containing protein